MKFYVLTAVLLCLAPLTVAAQSRTGQSIPLAGSAAQQPAVSLTALAVQQSATSVATGTTVARGPIMRLVQRRRLGLTVKNILRVLKGMETDGRLAEFRYEEDGQEITQVSALAVVVAQEIRAENPAGWEDIDWEALFAFLERIIMLLLELFM